MKRTFVALASTAAIAAFALAPAPASARDGGAIAAGVIGGLAAGAIIAGAANGGYYGPGPAGYYGAYGGPAPGCFIRRERVWDGYGWRMQRVRVCY